MIELVVLLSCCVSAALSDGGSCSSFGEGEGGNVYPHTTFGFGKGHELYSSKVQISKPAPPFTASGISSGQVKVHMLFFQNCHFNILTGEHRVRLIAKFGKETCVQFVGTGIVSSVVLALLSPTHHRNFLRENYKKKFKLVEFEVKFFP